MGGGSGARWVIGTRDVTLNVPFGYVNGLRAYAFPTRDAMLHALTGLHAILIALNAEKVANAGRQLRELVNRHVGYADGYGVVLALRRKGLRSARVAGSDLWLELAHAAGPDQSAYLIGGRDDVVRRSVAKLGSEAPGLRIAGFRDGYLSNGDVALLADDLQQTKPTMVFVAMGSPRQEELMDRLIGAWPALYVGLGGSFDVYVGDRRRAPRWVQRAGLEWLYRFVENPRRLPRLPAYARFAWMLALGRL